jgi:hypothetical protein
LTLPLLTTTRKAINQFLGTRIFDRIIKRHICLTLDPTIPMSIIRCLPPRLCLVLAATTSVTSASQLAASFGLINSRQLSLRATPPCLIVWAHTPGPTQRLVPPLSDGWTIRLSCLRRRSVQPRLCNGSEINGDGSFGEIRLGAGPRERCNNVLSTFIPAQATWRR